MRRFPLKMTLAILTFFIGVGAVGLWYLSRIEAESQRSLADAVSSIPPVKMTVENPCDYPQPKHRALEAEEAVYLAECFIIQNGYTDLPPLADKSQLTPENVFPGTDEEGMKMRRDSLERKAYGYERDNELYDDGGWVIAFRYKPHPHVVRFLGDRLNFVGRAVTMNFYGKKARVRHTDYSLRTPDLRKINP